MTATTTAGDEAAGVQPKPPTPILLEFVRERESGGDGVEEAVLATAMATTTTTSQTCVPPTTGARPCSANDDYRQRKMQNRAPTTSARNPSFDPTQTIGSV